MQLAGWDGPADLARLSDQLQRIWRRRTADQWGDGRPPRLGPDEKSELVARRNPEAIGISAFAREGRGHLPRAVRQEPACDVDESDPARVAVVATESETSDTLGQTIAGSRPKVPTTRSVVSFLT